jgi:hypothetical protein
MKKILYLVLLAPLFLVAQNSSLEIHTSFENKEGVNSFTFSKMMLDAIDMTTENEDGSIQHITGDLHKVKFLNFNEDTADSTNNFKKLNKLFNKSSYQLIDLEDEDTEGVKIYIEKKGKYINEIHLLLEDIGEGSLISIYGKFKSEELCAISNALNMNVCNHFKYIK